MLMYEWLMFASGWLIIWLILFTAKPFLRKQMFWVSIFTMFAGLTEPLFVPKYWSPPSLFDLAATTHFDVESFIFSFATGGIGSVLYEATLNIKHYKRSSSEFKEKRWFHSFSIISTPFIFAFLLVLTNLNPIYSASIALFLGAVAAVVCRPDLAKNMVVGGLLFMALYFVFFFFTNLFIPNFTAAWNLAALSGVVFLGVPLEELIFAFTFGMLWSGLYEHIKHYALGKIVKMVS